MNEEILEDYFDRFDVNEETREYLRGQLETDREVYRWAFHAWMRSRDQAGESTRTDYLKALDPMLGNDGEITADPDGLSGTRLSAYNKYQEFKDAVGVTKVNSE